MKNRYIKWMLFFSISGLILTSCYKEFDPKSYAPAFTINGFSSAKQIKPANLVGYWAFDGSLIDSVSKTSGANHGTSFVNGFKGQALSLNLSNKSYMTFNLSNTITGMQSFTISFWVNPTFVDTKGAGSIDGILGLVNLSNVTGFWGNVDWFVENGSNPTATTMKIHVTNGPLDTWIVKSGITGFFGSWTNQTITYDAATSNLTYYINGSVVVPATKAPWTGPLAFTNSGPMVIGCVQFQTTPSLTSSTGAQDWASYLTGSIDEVRIYNAALTPSEVNSLVVLQGKGK